MRRFLSSLTGASILLFGVSTAAQTVDPDASIVHLRTACDIDNCFTDTEDLTEWLWEGGRTSPPSAGDRVTVQVGPGSFDPFVCDGSAQARGYVSVVGSGRQQSRFVRLATGPGPDGKLGACGGAIHVENCRELDFSHLTAIGETGVFWLGGGSATWSDVDMIGEPQGGFCGLGALGWYDLPGAGGRSLHYIFGSRVFGRGHPIAVSALDVVDAEIWFYGGDVVAEATGSGTAILAAANVTNAGDLRLFGSSVRARVEPGAAVSGGFYGAWVHDGGKLHLHGAIVNASADQGSGAIDAYGIFAEDAGSMVHTPGTAFVVNAAGSGVATRVAAVGGAMVHSPFVWPASTSPPPVETLHGADAFVETDAGPSGNEAHLMVRDASCAGAGGPWRDMATGQCRP